MVTDVHTKTCKRMFITGLFVIPKRKGGEWTNCGLTIQWNLRNKEQTIDIHSSIDKSQQHYAE